MERLAIQHKKVNCHGSAILRRLPRLGPTRQNALPGGRKVDLANSGTRHYSEAGAWVPLCAFEASMSFVNAISHWRRQARQLPCRAEAFWSERLFPAATPSIPKAGKRFWLGVAALIVLAGCLFLPNRSFPLMEPDEGRRAEISREILVNDDWIACTLNQQPYYDK